jgi:hypothetical protein
VQPLPGGNTFVGWGSQRWFSEYDARGRLVLDGRLARGNDSYRASRFAWSGHPDSRPKAFATRRDNRVIVRVSWNGATDVARWELLAGPNADALEPVAATAHASFETHARRQHAAALRRRPRARRERHRAGPQPPVETGRGALAARAAPRVDASPPAR